MNSSPLQLSALSSSPKKNECEIFVKYGVDTRDFSRAEERVKHLAENDLKKNNSDVLTELLNAWEDHVENVTRSFMTRFQQVTDELSDQSKELSGTRRAELLSKWAALAEKYTCKNANVFSIPEPADVAKIVVACCESASAFLRLLAFHTVKVMSGDDTFLGLFYTYHGHYSLAHALDGENDQESEAALEVITTITEQALDKKRSQFSTAPMASGLVERLCSSPKSNKSGPFGSGSPAMPYGLIMRIVTMIDFQDTRHQNIPNHRKHFFLSLLKDMLLLWPLQATAAGAIRTLFYAAVHGNLTKEQTDMIFDAVLPMYDSPSTRRYFRHSDLHVLFSPFLCLEPKDPTSHLTVLNQAKELLVRLMSSWPGLFWVASETMSLRSLVDLLHLPGPVDNKMVALSFFNALLRRCAPLRGIPQIGPWFGVVEEKKRAMTVAGDHGGGFDLLDQEDVRNISFDSNIAAHLEGSSFVNGDDDGVPTTKAVGYNALDPLLGTVLLILDRAGLARALTVALGRSAVSESSAILVEWSSMSLQHLLVLMDTVLPMKHSTQLHDAINTEVARSTQNPASFHVTMKLFSDLANVSRTNRIENDLSLTFMGGAPVMIGLANSQLSMEDQQFQQLLRDSLVESYNEHHRWNFDMLLILVQGPLKNVNKLRWARDNTRFFARVLTFFKPSSNRASFASVPKMECQPQVVAFGTALIDVLLSTRDGVEILEKAEILKAFKAAFQEVFEGRPLIFTKERIATTMTVELFRFFGRFTANAFGLTLMLKQHFFGLLQQLFEEASKPQALPLVIDVCHRTLQHLHLETVPNYGVSIEARLLLKMALNCHLNLIRLCGIQQLKRVMWRDLSTSLQWGISRMVECVAENTLVVVENSFKLLTSICASSEEALDYLIAQSPDALVTNSLLNDNRKRLNTTALLFRILGRPEGFKFLEKLGWVQQELEQWSVRDAIAYVDEVDRVQGPGSERVEETATGRRSRSHTRTYSDSVGRSSASHRPRGVSISTAIQSTHTLFPLHLVGELCRSSEGCATFIKSPIFTDALNSILDNTEPNDALSLGNASILSRDVGSPSSFLVDTSPLGGSAHEYDITYSQEQLKEHLQAIDSSFDFVLPQAKMSEDIAEDLGDLLEMEEIQQAARQLRRDAEMEDETRNKTLLLSACRGYDTQVTKKTVGCHGDIKQLRAAIFTISHMGSSDVGLTYLQDHHMDVLLRLVDLAHYASHPTVRGTSIVSMTLLGRCECGEKFLASNGYSCVSASTAYVSSFGVPFSISFCHPQHSDSWMHLPPVPHLGHTPSQARRLHSNSSLTNVPPTLLEHVNGLMNPVSREGCKGKLYQTFKGDPLLFVNPDVIKAFQGTLSIHRMRHQERKFVADLLNHARGAALQKKKAAHAAAAARAAAEEAARVAAEQEAAKAKAEVVGENGHTNGVEDDDEDFNSTRRPSEIEGAVKAVAAAENGAGQQ